MALVLDLVDQPRADLVAVPGHAEQVLVDFAREAGVKLFRESRLDRVGGVSKNERSITEIRLEDGTAFRGKQFIDATYEGDLMAAANVSYFVGREANAAHGETLNGVQTRQATKHQQVIMEGLLELN